MKVKHGLKTEINKKVNTMTNKTMDNKVIKELRSENSKLKLKLSKLEKQIERLLSNEKKNEGKPEKKNVEGSGGNFYDVLMECEADSQDAVPQMSKDVTKCSDVNSTKKNEKNDKIKFEVLNIKKENVNVLNIKKENVKIEKTEINSCSLIEIFENGQEDNSITLNDATNTGSIKQKIKESEKLSSSLSSTSNTLKQNNYNTNKREDKSIGIKKCKNLQNIKQVSVEIMEPEINFCTSTFSNYTEKQNIIRNTNEKKAKRLVQNENTNIRNKTETEDTCTLNNCKHNSQTNCVDSFGAYIRDEVATLDEQLQLQITNK